MSNLMDENEILTRSIGETAVDAIGRDHLRSLSVLFDARDASCTITFSLSNNGDEEQLRALDRLVDIQLMFVDEASIEIQIEDKSDLGLHEDHQTLSQRQYCYA